MKEKLRERIVVSKKRNPGFFTYIRRKVGTNQIEAVLCKLCRVPIRILQEIPTGESETKGKMIIRYVRQALITLPNYYELLIEFDDGSAHSTPICRVCVEKPHPPEQLEDMYVADMAQWEEDERPGSTVRWDKLEHRKPEAK
jgi:hypothetical protein